MNVLTGRPLREHIHARSKSFTLLPGGLKRIQMLLDIHNPASSRRGRLLLLSLSVVCSFPIHVPQKFLPFLGLGQFPLKSSNLRVQGVQQSLLFCAGLYIPGGLVGSGGGVGSGCLHVCDTTATAATTGGGGS